MLERSDRTDRSQPGAAPARDAFPRVEDSLIAALERVFPDRTPDSALSHEEIRERIGETRVLRFLKAQRDRQARRAIAFARHAAPLQPALSSPPPETEGTI